MIPYSPRPRAEAVRGSRKTSLIPPPLNPPFSDPTPPLSWLPLKWDFRLATLQRFCGVGQPFARRAEVETSRSAQKVPKRAPRPPRFPRLFLAAKQDGLAYIMRAADAQAWELWGCVLYFVAKLDSPSNIWEVVYETSEKCDTDITVSSMG